MRLALALLLSAVASAQPTLVAEATVDQETYAYGEPITLRYTVRNVGTETATLWGSSSCRLVFEYEGVDLSWICTLDESPTRIGAGHSVTVVWTIDPATLGVPVVGGRQVLIGRTHATCGPTIASATPCPEDLDVAVSFEAPAYLGGRLLTAYDEANADSVAALRASYNGAVIESVDYGGSLGETWQIEGTALDEAVADLRANGVLQFAEAIRDAGAAFVFESVATEPRRSLDDLTAPVPNPTAGRAAFAVSLDRTGPAVVDVVDALGRRVAVLHDGLLAGTVAHPFVFEGSTLPAGVYAVRVVAAGRRQLVRVTVVR